MRDLLLIAGGILALAPVCGCDRSNQVPDCRGVDLSERHVSPFADDGQVTVLVFVSCDCPISNRYVPTLRALQEQYAAKPVRFWLVYPDPDVTAREIERHLQEYRPHIPVLRDPGHELVQAAGVTTVPEAAVFVRHDGRQVLTYHGSIDDRFVDFGVARVRATKHYLHDVLEANLAGKVEVFPSLPAIGCPIPGIR